MRETLSLVPVDAGNDGRLDDAAAATADLTYAALRRARVANRGWQVAEFRP